MGGAPLTCAPHDALRIVAGMEMTILFPEPLRIAAGTYLIRPLGQAPGAPVAMHVNSMVIQGAEPTIVDCSAALLREQWREQVFSLVDPVDVRWIFLSHDDTDHTGNLELTLEMCPNATLVTSWFANERMAGRCSSRSIVSAGWATGSRSTPATDASSRCAHRRGTPPPLADCTTP